MSRYDLAPAQVARSLDDIIQTRNEFKHLREAVFIILMDSKKKKSSGKIVLGSVKKASDIERTLYIDPEGVFGDPDFIMFLDENVFNVVSDEDKVRVLRHELNHCSVNDKGVYTIVGHEITDFHQEIEFNKEDPRWLERVSTVAEALYDEE